MREGLREWTAFSRVGGDWERVLNMGKGLENKIVRRKVWEM